MKKQISDWTKKEKNFLLIGLILIFTTGIIFKSDLLTISASFCGFLCALTQAKGKIISQFIGLIEVFLYSMVSYRSHYYGEVITYMVILLPLYIAGIYSWMTHQDKESKKVIKNEISKKESIILFITNIFLFIMIYQLLKYFHTSQLIISTLSLIVSLTATYLIVRRSKYGFLFYIINDIILIILWGIPVIKGELILIPLIIDVILLFINDTYGWKKWNKK